MKVVFISSVAVVVADPAQNRKLSLKPSAFRYERKSAWRVESSRWRAGGPWGRDSEPSTERFGRDPRQERGALHRRDAGGYFRSSGACSSPGGDRRLGLD